MKFFKCQLTDVRALCVQKRVYVFLIFFLKIGSSMFVKSLKIKIIFLYVIVTICATKEVNNESKIKYGTKLDIRNKNNGTVISNAKHVKGLQVNVPDLRNSNNVNRTTSRSSSRRYEMLQKSTQRKNQHQNEQLPIMQYNIPIVNKNYNNALSYESQRQSTDRTRNNGNASEKLVFKTNAASAIPQNTKTKSSLRNNEERRINTRRPANINDNNDDKLSTMPVSRSKTRKTIIPAAETTDTTTTIATSTNRQQQQQKQFANPFEFITQSVWNLFNPQPLPYVTTPSTTPPSTTSRKPPKKYKPAETFTTLVSAKQLANKEEKQNYQKLKTAQSTKTPSPINKHTSTNNNNSTTTNSDGPFRIALPTLFNLEHDKEKRATAAAASVILRQRFECPRESEVRFQLFPKICKTDNDCAVWERDELCCDIFGAKSCVSGVPKPLEEAKHAPILGLIPRKCPTRPLAELWWDVQECHTDMDCWPRVCCPDGRRRYCRTSQPELETVPVPVKRSFNYLTEYLECTAAPPRIFDLHPKACTSTLDCFPNVCCQEAGLRHCRPPKKSLLTLMANFLNVDFVKRLTQNLVIK